MLEYLKKLDQELFLQLNGFHTDWMDPIMAAISDKYTWIPLYAILLILIIKQFRKSTWLPVLIIVVIIVVSDQLSVHLFKNVFQRLRPCQAPELEGLVHTINGKCGGQFGFISSHASNTFALATFIIGILHKHTAKILIWIMVIWAFLNAYSRVYLGVHYPGDVLVGALFGSSVSFIFLKVYHYLQANFNFAK